MLFVTYRFVYLLLTRLAAAAAVGYVAAGCALGFDAVHAVLAAFVRDLGLELTRQLTALLA